MKLVNVILIALIITLNANCQTVPLRTLSYEMPNGSYAKDLDNELPFWIDTWKGTVNNKKYTFTFVLFAQHLRTSPNGDFRYKDLIVGKLKVIDLSTNSTLHDESSYVNYDDFVINGIYLKENKFYFSLFDKENYCNNSADFTFEKDPNNPNQITYKDFKYGEYHYFDCPYANQEDIPMFLPKVDLVLTRQ